MWVDADIFFQIRAGAAVRSIDVVALSAAMQTWEKENIFVTGVKENITEPTVWDNCHICYKTKWILSKKIVHI